MTIALMLVGMVALVLLGVPIAIALGIVAVTAMVATAGPALLPNVALVMYTGATSFPLLAWTGWRVLQVLGGVHLISLPWVSVQLTQSVIPIGATLFIVAQLLSLPDVLRRARDGAPPPGHEERASP